MTRVRIAVRLPFAAALVASVFALAVGRSAMGQINSGTSPLPTATTHNGHTDDRDDPFHNNPEVLERLQRARETERQRRIVDDAKRLVELTAVYQKSLQAHGKPTEEDQKLLVQIEKLAREVKDRMRGM